MHPPLRSVLPRRRAAVLAGVAREDSLAAVRGRSWWLQGAVHDHHVRSRAWSGAPPLTAEGQTCGPPRHCVGLRLRRMLDGPPSRHGALGRTGVEAPRLLPEHRLQLPARAGAGRLSCMAAVRLHMIA